MSGSTYDIDVSGDNLRAAGAFITDQAPRLRVAAWLAILYQRFLLAVMLLEIPLVIDSYFGYDAFDHRFGAVSGFNVSITTICLGFLYLQWLPVLVVQSKRLRIHWPLTFYVLIAALSVCWSISTTRYVYGFWIIFQAYLIFVYLDNHLKTRDDVMFVFRLLLIGVAIQSILMVFIKFWGQDLVVGPLEIEISEDGRVGGTFGAYNIAASLLVLFLASAVATFLLDVSKRLKFVALIVTVIGGIALVFTLSRGGWMATGVSIFLFSAIAYRKRWLSARFVFAMLFVVTLLLIGFSHLLAERLTADDNGSAASRWPLILITLKMVLDSPLGVGINNWDLGAIGYAAASSLRQEWFFIVHNKFALVLGELGFLGLIAYLSFLGSVIWKGWKSLDSTSHALAPLQCGLTVGFAGLMLHMCVDIFNNRGQVQILWIVAAVILALARVMQSESGAERTGSERLATSAGIGVSSSRGGAG